MRQESVRLRQESVRIKMSYHGISQVILLDLKGPKVANDGCIATDSIRWDWLEKADQRRLAWSESLEQSDLKNSCGERDNTPCTKLGGGANIT